jgi:hypothetical protein
MSAQQCSVQLKANPFVVVVVAVVLFIVLVLVAV